MPYDPARHGPRRIVGPGFHAKVHALVRRVPKGRVVTYGDLAEALGSRSVARQVGFAMAAVGDADVPWWRVVAAGGRLAPGTAMAQARALRKEGVAVKDHRVQDFARRHFAFGGLAELPLPNQTALPTAPPANTGAPVPSRSPPDFLRESRPQMPLLQWHPITTACSTERSPTRPTPRRCSAVRCPRHSQPRSNGAH